MKVNLLIADRDPGLARAAERCMHQRGINVLTATDGLQCLDVLRTASPVILVMDPKILWGGGEGVIDWLLGEESLRPPMIVITEGSDSKRLPERLEPWIDLRLHRPESLGELPQFVNQLESLASWSLNPDREPHTAVSFP